MKQRGAPRRPSLVVHTINILGYNQSSHNDTFRLLIHVTIFHCLYCHLSFAVCSQVNKVCAKCTCAAMLTFPTPWKHRIVGILAVPLAVQLLNIVRVIRLFYLGQWSMIAFEWAHLSLWQALIMLDVLIICLAWIHILPSTSNASYPAAVDDNAQPTTEL